MTDIQQWRRMIQPARVRSPAIVDLNEWEAEVSPEVHRKPLRPTFTTSRSQADVSSHSVRLPDHDTIPRRAPSWIIDQPDPNPSIDELVDSLMCNLLGNPFNGLTARFASDLMRVFEAYRYLKDDKKDLLAKLEQEQEKCRSIQLAWDRERKNYKAEVRRLELILSQGKRGLAEVTLARQDSVLKRGKRGRATDDSGLEAILEHLEKSKSYEDKTWGSQRAIMRQRSPSSKMKRLSKTLTSKTSKRHGFVEVPVGTLPSGRFSFLQASTVDYPPLADHTPRSEPRISVSDDDTFSMSSSVGDLLRDETVNVAYSVTSAARIPGPSAAQATQPVILTRKTATLRMKASGFLSKIRPQLTIDISNDRRVSFEAGDDANTALSAPPLDPLSAGGKSRLLRKSASMSTLENKVAPVAMQDSTLSPIVQNPTTSTAVDAAETAPEIEDHRRQTRIPTPMYQRTSLAQPRRERDDSLSSLLTAFRPSEDASQMSTSRSSSAFISPSGSRVDLTQGLHGLDVAKTSASRTSGSHRLIDHTNSLRGSALVNGSVAKAANVAMQSADQTLPSGLERRPSVLSSNNSRTLMHVGTIADTGQLQEENHRPMGDSGDGTIEGDATR